MILEKLHGLQFPHVSVINNFKTFLQQLAPTKNPSLINAMKFVKNPYKMCERLYKLVQSLTGQLKELIAQKNYDPRGMIVAFLAALKS